MEFKSYRINTSAKLVMSSLFVAILAACGGGGSGSKNRGAVTNPTGPNKINDVIKVPPIGGVTQPPEGPKVLPDGIKVLPDPPARPLTTVKMTPGGNAPLHSSDQFTGKNVKIGVHDAGFGPDATFNHPAAIASRVKGNINDLGDVTGYHGSVVARVIAGQDIGDGFRAGLAHEADVYLASTGTSMTAIQLQTDLNAFDAAGVKIINNSRGVATASNSAATLSDIQGFSLDEDGRQQLDVYANGVQTKGQLHIWANGNHAGSQPQILAAAPLFKSGLEQGWLAVRQRNAGNNSCGAAANWCLDVDVPNGLKGSSYAAAVATATAAQVAEAHPWMTNSEIRQTLLSSTGAFDPSKTLGWGTLDGKAAVQGPRRFDKRLALGDQFVANVGSGMDSTFSNDIRGDAGLLKQGDGTLRLTGWNLYTGKTRIEAGTLETTSLADSDVVIRAPGTLAVKGGTSVKSIETQGTIRIEQGATHNDLLSSRALSVAEDFLALPGSELHLAPNVDLVVSGTATIEGSTLLLSDVASEEIGKERIVLYTANRQGQFKNVLSDERRLLLGVNTRYSPRGVAITVDRLDVGDVAEKHFAGDTSRLASARAIESGLQEFDAAKAGTETSATEEFTLNAVKLLGSESTSQLAASLDSASGQIHASSQALTFQQSQAMNRALSDRLDSVSQSGGTTGAWAQAVGATGKLSQSGFATGSTNTFGAQIGLDHRIAEHSVVGAAIGFSEGSARFNRYGGKSEGQALGLSVYGRQGQDTGIYVAGRLGFEHIDSKVKRDIVLGSDTEKLKSKRRDNLFSAYAETGHVFDVNGTRITPFVGISLDSLNRGKIAERDHALGLQAKAKTYNQTAGILGLRLQSAAFDWAGGSTTFNSYAAYRYGSKTNLDFNAGFTGAPNAAFTVKGIGMQQHSGWLGVGVQTAATANVSWFANYNMQVGRGGVNNQVISAGMRYAF